jgi:hypothetical protein
MDKDFGQEASAISSRAIAVSAYLFAERLFLDGKKSSISKFATFYVALINEIQKNLKRLTKFQSPENKSILEDFHKYVSQASVEPYSVKRRQLFLERAFSYYQSKGKIIGSN